jgi:hypothetical protein
MTFAIIVMKTIKNIYSYIFKIQMQIIPILQNPTTHDIFVGALGIMSIKKARISRL